jgi:hypothetical protein
VSGLTYLSEIGLEFDPRIGTSQQARCAVNCLTAQAEWQPTAASAVLGISRGLLQAALQGCDHCVSMRCLYLCFWVTQVLLVVLSTVILLLRIWFAWGRPYVG